MAVNRIPYSGYSMRLEIQGKTLRKSTMIKSPFKEDRAKASEGVVNEVGKKTRGYL